jgi:ppGpp synthetase/RelA/SpoT-type nucleotidyltranferase
MVAMSPEATITLGIGIVTLISSLIGVIYYVLALKVHDLEEKTVTKELFRTHTELQTKHIDERFSRQDHILEKIADKLDQRR